MLQSVGRTAGTGRVRTLAIRPVGIYGEQDSGYVTLFLKVAEACGGSFYTFSGLGAHSISYAGNTAWAHIVASRTLKEHPNVAGQAFIITDDNRCTTYAEFAEPFLEARGYHLSNFRIPFWLAFCMVSLIQFLMFLVLPVWKVEFAIPVSRGSLIKMKRTMIFSGKKAREQLGYKPLYTYLESFERSVPFYTSVSL